MNAKELEDLFSPIWGVHGWQKRLSEYSKYSPQQINKLADKSGKYPIKESTAVYFKLIAKAVQMKLSI